MHISLYKRIPVCDSSRMVSEQIRAYLAELGRRGGKSRSPRKLAACARSIVKARAARTRKAKRSKA
jgi:hypothetical protein